MIVESPSQPIKNDDLTGSNKHWRCIDYGYLNRFIFFIPKWCFINNFLEMQIYSESLREILEVRGLKRDEVESDRQIILDERQASESSNVFTARKY